MQSENLHIDALLQNGVFCRGGLLASLGLSSVGELWLPTFLAFCALSIGLTVVMSGSLFYFYYWPSQVTYEKWTRKTNPKFPPPEKVRDEITQMLKSSAMTAVCPATSIWLAVHNSSQAFCGSQTPFGVGWAALAYNTLIFLLVFIISDFFEFFYHYLGHKIPMLWEHHRAHHKFYNPSPFAVIADEMVDQFFRSSPLLVFPLLFPVNIDLLFMQFGVFFYVYGCYLHWGYEFDCLDAHHPYMNTSFQHYCHHARGTVGKPYHCGFFLKLWDQIFGAMYDGDCFCVKCERAKGNRTREQFDQVVVPDYSKLLSPGFWFCSESSMEKSFDTSKIMVGKIKSTTEPLPNLITDVKGEAGLKAAGKVAKTARGKSPGAIAVRSE
eukprot:gnl/TRDRNA2_/TRDRNA2_83363_c0_seq1.p1 gnl/TRDRNA2_/TRDRNA2_83363_c0~~gnl/TRDRNA2_/TRDRNA2_83363_c0_seq1.p1  ORF type:complete len:381 (+),score=58.08 gnl/TRDRNA2_/TRDRNA2_83363_c0_seq1:100-1242(+)